MSLNYNMFEIREMINCITSSVNVYGEGFWIIYGSYAIGEQNEHSDMDVMYVTDIDIDKPIRLSLTCYNVPVSLYVLSKSQLLDDGHGRYGGFFVGKTLNPNVVVAKKIKDARAIIHESIGCFISPLCKLISYERPQSKGFTVEDIAAHCLLAYLRMCPSYIIYWVRYFVSGKLDHIWNWYIENIFSSLCTTNSIVKVNHSHYRYTSSSSIIELQVKMVDYIASFWSYAAVCHADEEFYRTYCLKGAHYLHNNRYEELTMKIQHFIMEKMGETNDK